MRCQRIRHDEVEFVVVRFTVAHHTPITYSGAAHDDYAFLTGLDQCGLDLRGKATIADARVNDALVPGGDEGVERNAVHVGVPEHDIDRRQRLRDW